MCLHILFRIEAYLGTCVCSGTCILQKFVEYQVLAIVLRHFHFSFSSSSWKCLWRKSVQDSLPIQSKLWNRSGICTCWKRAVTSEFLGYLLRLHRPCQSMYQSDCWSRRKLSNQLCMGRWRRCERVERHCGPSSPSWLNKILFNLM